MTLPRLLVLTDRSQCPGSLTDTVAAAVDAGARAVVLREKDLPGRERDELVDRLRALLDPVGGLLVRAGPGAADAVHLAAHDTFPAPRPRLVGRSCHSAAELTRARAEGCDWAFLSPVFLTPSKPGYGPALGPAGLAALAPLGPPVYALGGIGAAEVAGCLAAGAHGVAVMGSVMRDPGSVRDLLAALDDAPG
ncbi:thiamine phosphate synthase [Modestobacter italicus]|uniref:thiamine phosphate synthase n=1 Tax=Modestobacter italicus (strain DSM 44449 / CECT 9708 / BC 501) TaxID=2732864 RepID=UPI001C93A9CA|nr:thiamine phosphate synthase [Modestobacter italicus]